MRRPRPARPGPGQESVWDYPRPPALEETHELVEVELGGVVVARTTRSWRVLETSHPPSYYIPKTDITSGLLRQVAGSSFCEWKGTAVYYDVEVDGVVLSRVGWSYPDPSSAFQSLRDHVAFYAAPFDRCSVDGETVRPQPGAFYGGWITDKLAGPFKGIPGSRGW